MKILIADAFSPDAVEILKEDGHILRVDPTLSGGALTAAIAEFEPVALVVRSTKVTAADLDASTSLELIVRAGAGVDTIDVEGAAHRGIFVANCPGMNAVAVAELALGLILALDRRIPDNVIAAREGRWEKAAFSKASGIKGRTLGLIGLGNIGRELGIRAKACGMDVIAWSRSLTDTRAEMLNVRRMNSPLEVAAEADVISLHVASTPDTRNIVNAAFVEQMKPGAFLINTARANIVDDEALLKGLNEKNIRFATDVPSGEPAIKSGEFKHPLADHPNLYITHHIGASTEQATEAIGTEALNVLRTYARSGTVLNSLNLATQTPATHLLTVRHRDRVGVLAGILNEVRLAGWNIQEMENLIFAGNEAACARIRFDGRPSTDALEAIQSVDDVLAATIIAV